MAQHLLILNDHGYAARPEQVMADFQNAWTI
jgi:hypothetical protein